MGILLFLLVIAAVAAALFWYRRQSAPTTKPQFVANRFHAVAIRFHQDACPAVKALANIRFLAKEAPHLPLDGCTASNCKCQYRHYDDRRDGEDRRAKLAGARHEGEQRRYAREDRRKAMQ